MIIVLGWLGYNKWFNTTKDIEVKKIVNTELTQKSDSTTTTILSNGDIGIVFGNKIDPIAYKKTVTMLQSIDALDLFEFNTFLDLSPDASAEDIALYIHSLPFLVDEALRLMGQPPTKNNQEIIDFLNKSSSEKEKTALLKNFGIADVYWDTYIDMIARTSKLNELYNKIDATHQAGFDPLFKKMINDIYTAFDKKLKYLDNQELQYLRRYSRSLSRDRFIYSDEQFLHISQNKDASVLVSNIEMPEQLKLSLLALEKTPNILTNLIKIGDYYYFGMVYTPQERIDYTPGFTRNDILALRFPSYSIGYELQVLILLFNNGYTNGDIVYSNYNGFLSNDADNDGLPCHIEVIYGSSDLKVDTDDDGYSDIVEYKNGFNPIKK